MRFAILVSGRGSNMDALLDCLERPEVAGEVALVLSNRPKAPALERARERGITTLALPHRAYPNRAAFDSALAAQLRAARVDCVLLAGFMRILTDEYFGGFDGPTINIHPSLLPLFPGLDTHQRALDAGVRVHGCTVHLAVPEVDAGPILGQAVVPVFPDDTEASLASRVLAQEHRLYPRIVESIARGRLVRQESRAWLSDRGKETGSLLVL